MKDKGSTATYRSGAVRQGYFSEFHFRALGHVLHLHHFNRRKTKQIITATSPGKDGRCNKKKNN
jgi:hypothetical protein